MLFHDSLCHEIVDVFKWKFQYSIAEGSTFHLLCGNFREELILIISTDLEGKKR